MSLCHLLDCYLEHNGKWWEGLKLEVNLVLPRRGSQLRYSFQFVVVCLPAGGEQDVCVCTELLMTLKIGGQYT